jgi:hypothetical protein
VHERKEKITDSRLVIRVAERAIRTEILVAGMRVLQASSCFPK